MSKSKRRPGRDPEMKTQSDEVQTEFKVVDVEGAVASEGNGKSEHHAADTDFGSQTDQNFASSSSSSASDSSSSNSAGEERTFEETLSEGPKVELNFKGSEILRAKFPKPFEVAEQIATDWVHDGRFEGLPLGHPLAQYFAAKGLRKAKEVEKKVMESPVTEKVAMRALTAGMKAQEIINQVRSKVRK